MSQIVNIYKLVCQRYNLEDKKRPTIPQIVATHVAARKAGILLGDDGRAYAPFVPNKKGMKYVNGRYVPRFQVCR